MALCFQRLFPYNNQDIILPEICFNFQYFVEVSKHPETYNASGTRQFKRTRTFGQHE